MVLTNVKFCCMRSLCEEPPRVFIGRIDRVNFIPLRKCNATREAVARAAKVGNNPCDHGGVGSVGEDVVDKKKKEKKKKNKMMDKKWKKRKTEVQYEQPALKKKKTKKKKLEGSSADLENPVVSQLKLCSTTQAEKMVVADPDPKCP